MEPKLYVLYNLSGDGLAVASNLITHSPAKHFDTDVKLSLGTLDHFHFVPLARIAEAYEALEAAHTYAR